MLNRVISAAALVILSAGILISQPRETKIILNVDQSRDTISRHIYGQFSEHLGHGIYGGIWVGTESSIPNTRGIRNDVVAALKRIKIPNLRWPGGCFADEYHWMDGIGPREKRPRMVNTHWGGVVEDNSFGTHEFMDLCDQLGTEPYICGNLGSGSVEEMSKWVEYLTLDGESPMAKLRAQNGREKPWKVRFWGVGNENWGCGGSMTASFYSDQFRRYATYCRNYGSNKLVRIAGGPYGGDTQWMETLMKNIPLNLLGGVSLHNYTLPRNWSDKGSATSFDEEEYFTTVEKALKMDDILVQQSRVMDIYDPAKKVGLMVDEWGNWYDVEPGTNPGFLYQQNTLRDALTAALNLNIFNNHCDRVKMANIAQTINVLQSLILTDGSKMVLTPTFFVYEMYTVHHDAAMIPLKFQSSSYELKGRAIPAVHASASKDAQGRLHMTLVNLHASKAQSVRCEIRGASYRTGSGTIISGASLQSHNTVETPAAVSTSAFSGFRIDENVLTIDLPAKSVVMVELK
ncbi:MAG TPA: alpha-L-arabinofuranosidase C-terminal domain-containing protein [Bacteroidota bacterium]|nr:alpha-L-arabinofuranosidase C-terminal domain-containing protein [Bacteroidota bacterium]